MVVVVLLFSPYGSQLLKIKVTGLRPKDCQWHYEQESCFFRNLRLFLNGFENIEV